MIKFAQAPNFSRSRNIRRSHSKAGAVTPTGPPAGDIAGDLTMHGVNKVNHPRWPNAVSSANISEANVDGSADDRIPNTPRLQFDVPPRQRNDVGDPSDRHGQHRDPCDGGAEVRSVHLRVLTLWIGIGLLVPWVLFVMHRIRRQHKSDASTNCTR